jgi:hypothetical protein
MPGCYYQLTKLQDWGGFQWHSIHTKFHDDQSTGSEGEIGNRLKMIKPLIKGA